MVRRGCTGQALLECLIVCLALVPLWFAVHRIARWQDLQAAVVQQTRQVGFAAALSPSRSGAIAANAEFAMPLQDSGPIGAYQRDPRSGLRVIDLPNGVRHTLEHRSPPGVAGVAQASALTVVQSVDALAPRRPEWGFDSWLNARVEVDVALAVDLPDNPVVRRHWSENLRLLVDDGSLPGPREVAARTDALLPQTPLDLAHRSLQPLTPVVAVLEPAARQLCARRVDPEQVPHDRLLAARSPADGQLIRGWRPAC